MNFTYRCENCGHEDKYNRNDLSYRDETMPSRIQSKKCGNGRANPRGTEK